MLARRQERDGAWLCACVLLLCGAATLAAAAAEREAQLAQAPFIMGSRFGRSPPRLLLPRNDKFFFSSRYGKRSPPLEPPDLAPPLALSNSLAPHPAELTCDYTGVHSLYRCRPSDRYPSRRLDDSSPIED